MAAAAALPQTWLHLGRARGGRPEPGWRWGSVRGAKRVGGGSRPQQSRDGSPAPPPPPAWPTGKSDHSKRNRQQPLPTSHIKPKHSNQQDTLTTPFRFWPQQSHRPHRPTLNHTDYITHQPSFPTAGWTGPMCARKQTSRPAYHAHCRGLATSFSFFCLF